MKPETMILEDGSEIVLIHWLRQPRFGKHYLACMPGLTSFSAGGDGNGLVLGFRSSPVLRTEDTRGVSCPLCKGTKEFKEAEQELKALLGRR